MRRLRDKLFFTIKPLCIFLSFLAVAFLGSNSYAFDTMSNVTPIGSYSYNTNSSFNFLDSNNCRYVPQYYTVVNDNQDLTCSISRMTLRTSEISLQTGDIIEFTFLISVNNGAVSAHSTIGQFVSNTNNIEVFEQTVENMDTNQGQLKVYAKVWSNMSVSLFQFDDARGTGLVNLINSTGGGARMILGNYYVYRPVGGTDNSAIVGAINGQSQTQNNISQNTQNMVQEQQNTTNAVNDLKEAQEQANQDANDRYDDEKNTIESNITDGADIVDTSQLGLSLFNPFSIFANLSAGNCYNINTLSTLIHSPTATYCSWFGSTVRNIFSPFVTLFAGILLFNFGWSWAKKAGI